MPDPVAITRWSGPEEPELERIEAQLKKEGFETYAWTDPPGARYASHQHSYVEVRWVVAGRLTVGSEQGVVELGPGDRLDMPPGAPHWAKVGKDSEAVYLCGEKRALSKAV